VSVALVVADRPALEQVLTLAGRELSAAEVVVAETLHLERQEPVAKVAPATA